MAFSVGIDGSGGGCGGGGGGGLGGGGLGGGGGEGDGGGGGGEGDGGGGDGGGGGLGGGGERTAAAGSWSCRPWVGAAAGAVEAGSGTGAAWMVHAVSAIMRPRKARMVAK